MRSGGLGELHRLNMLGATAAWLSGRRVYCWANGGRSEKLRSEWGGGRARAGVHLLFVRLLLS